MGLRIEKEDLWKRLAVRYLARIEAEEEDPWPILLKTLQPTTDFDELAKTVATVAQPDVTRLHASGSGWETIIICPEGKRWEVYAFQAYRTVGDMTVSAIATYGAGLHCRLFTQGAASHFYSDMMLTPIKLDEGDVIDMSCAAVAADTTWGIAVFRQEEDAY